jgi:hypothetical protein
LQKNAKAAPLPAAADAGVIRRTSVIMEFGFLLNRRRFVVDNVEIRPLWDIEESISWFYREARVCNGWIYPPLQNASQNHREKNNNIECEIPSKWFLFEPTHTLTIHPYDQEKVKFLILCLGFLFGIYLAPAGYYCLGKVPYKEGQLTDVIPLKNDVEKGIAQASSFYDTNSSKRRGMFAILHWFLAGQSYDFPWDKFESQYKVLDGLFRISGLTSRNHASRAVSLASQYGVELPDWARMNGGKSKLSLLRNDLAHEAIYAGHPIGYAHPDENYDLEFRRFNTKLIAAILGLQTNYIHSSPHDRQLHGWGFV